MNNEQQHRPPSYIDITDIPYERTLIPRVTYPFFTLNCLTGGAEEGSVNIICSSSDNGKSTLTMNCINQFIRDGEKVVAFLGEHTFRKAQSIFYKQITTFDKTTWTYVPYKKNGVEVKGIGDTFISQNDEMKARNFFRKKLFLYNTASFDPTMNNIISIFEEARQKEGARVFVIDNMMQISYEKTNQELQEQRDNAEMLRNWAIKTNSIVFLIMHLKKFADRNTIKISMDDIAGSSNVSNKANTVISIIRTDKLNKETKEYKSFAKLLELNNFDIEKCDAVLDVLKVKSNSNTARLGMVGLQFFQSTQSYKEIDTIMSFKEWQEKNKRAITNVNNSTYNKNSNRNDFDSMEDLDDETGLPF